MDIHQDLLNAFSDFELPEAASPSTDRHSTDGTDYNLPPEKYAAILDRICPDDRNVWFEAMCAFKNFAERQPENAAILKATFFDWARGGSTFNAAENEAKWNEDLTRYPYGMQTLLRLEGESPAPRVDAATGEPEPEVDCWFASESNRNHNVAAQKFVEAYGGRVRYVSAWKKWLVWDGRRWVTDSGDVKVNNYIGQYADSLWDQIPRNLSSKEAAKVNTFLKSLNNVGGVQGVEKMSRGKNTCHYNDLDTNPYLLNVENGTLNMKTRELQPHDPNDMITKIADLVFDPSSKCPKWDETLRHVYQDDQKLIDYVEEVFGYMLTGDVGEAVLPILYGHGNNGKSTIWNTLSKISGEYVEMASENLMTGDRNDHPTEKADLFGKRLVIINEPDEGATLKEGRVKDLTGDPFIKARRMHEDRGVQADMHLCNGDEPLAKVAFNGQRSSPPIKQIPHNADFDKIEGLKVIKNYSDILAREEGSGILNHLLAGFHRYLERGDFDQPGAVTKATDEYLNEEDSLGRFIAECCELDPNAWETSPALFEAYQKEVGRDAKTQTSFGRALAERAKVSRTRRSVQGNKVTVYDGIRLLDGQR